jgi:hypothetical protein
MGDVGWMILDDAALGLALFKFFMQHCPTMMGSTMLDDIALIRTGRKTYIQYNYIICNIRARES